MTAHEPRPLRRQNRRRAHRLAFERHGPFLSHAIGKAPHRLSGDRGLALRPFLSLREGLDVARQRVEPWGAADGCDPALDELAAPCRGARRCREGSGRRGQVLGRLRLELLVTVVAAEDVDLPFVHDEIGGIASGGLAHLGAHSAELNLVSGGFALERGLAVGSGEEVDELAPRNAEGRLAWDFLAPDEKHWIEPVEGVDGLDGSALRSTGRAGGHEYDEREKGEHVHIVASLCRCDASTLDDRQEHTVRSCRLSREARRVVGEGRRSDGTRGGTKTGGGYGGNGFTTKTEDERRRTEAVDAAGWRLQTAASPVKAGESNRGAAKLEAPRTHRVPQFATVSMPRAYGGAWTGWPAPREARTQPLAPAFSRRPSTSLESAACGVDSLCASSFVSGPSC